MNGWTVIEQSLATAFGGLLLAGVIGLLTWLWASYKEFCKISRTVGSIDMRLGDAIERVTRQEDRGDNHEVRLTKVEGRVDVLTSVCGVVPIIAADREGG